MFPAAGVEFHFHSAIHPRPALRSALAVIHEREIHNEIRKSISGGFVFRIRRAYQPYPMTIAQTGNSANITGTVSDPSGGVVASATVTIHNPVSGYERTTTTDASGNFSFANVPFNPYHLSVSAAGFGAYAQDIDVRSSVPLAVKIGLTIAGSSSTVTVEGGGDLLENEPTFHTDVDRSLFDKLPLESASSSHQFPGHAFYSRRRRRLQRPVPRARRPRRKFVFRGRPAHHRPAEQGVFESIAN